MKNLVLSIATCAAAFLAGCQSVSQEPLRATAALHPTKGGKALGEATLEQEGNTVRVIVFAQGLAPDTEHALYVRTSGDCISGGGTSARLPALKAGKNGHANLDAVLEGATIAPGPASLVGHGLVIGADAAGGGEDGGIACGVIRAG
jgi:Cu-Zn family superoxide dismutase